MAELEPNAEAGTRADVPPRPTRRVWIVSVAIVLVATTGGAVWWLRGGGDDELRLSNPTLVYGGVPITRDATEFSVGNLQLSHPGEEVTVVEVRALTSPNVEFLGGYTVWPRDFAFGNLAVGPGFPPPQAKPHPLTQTVPAAETSFVPATDLDGKVPPIAVAVGFRLTSGDLGAVNGLQVVYKVDGKTVREVFRHAAIVCLPGCKQHPAFEDSDFSDQILGQLGLLPARS